MKKNILAFCTYKILYFEIEYEFFEGSVTI